MGDVLLRQITVAIAWMLDSLLWTYRWIVVIAVLLTWVNPDPYNSIVRFLRGVTEPVFYQVRRRLPFVVISGIDLSPIVVLFAVEALRIVVVRSLYELASRFAALAIGTGVG